MYSVELSLVTYLLAMYYELDSVDVVPALLGHAGPDLQVCDLFWWSAYLFLVMMLCFCFAFAFALSCHVAPLIT